VSIAARKAKIGPGLQSKALGRYLLAVNVLCQGVPPCDRVLCLIDSEFQVLGPHHSRASARGRGEGEGGRTSVDSS